MEVNTVYLPIIVRNDIPYNLCELGRYHPITNFHEVYIDIMIIMYTYQHRRVHVLLFEFIFASTAII